MQSERNLFERPSATYSIDPRALGWILADEANPLNRLVQIIPKGASVLDIGVGNGILARLLRHAHGDVVIDGVEPDPVAASFAGPHYRNLFQGTVETYVSGLSGSISHDFVVLADVIEHLPNPERLLRLLGQKLGPSARICISTPNVAFAAVRIALLNGCFDYVDSGILERTHLRFFTLRTLRHLFAAAQLHPESTMLLRRNPLATEIRLEDFSVSPFLLSTLLRDELASVYQFLFVLGSEPGDAVVASYGHAGRAVVLRYLVRRLARRFSRQSRPKPVGES